jgi:hypothetical protein
MEIDISLKKRRDIMPTGSYWEGSYGLPMYTQLLLYNG